MTKVTSFTSHTTPEGERISYTFSEIDDTSGELLKSNERRSIIIVDTDIISKIKEIREFLNNKL